MSKKKEVEEVLILGRFSHHLKLGIVGVPNAGKSTIFNVLCKQQVDAANYPFCTIDPNLSRCEVPDERFDYLCQFFKPLSVVPAFLQVTDIAGLVKGASEGQGLGNAFLSHINAVDGIFHMIRTFDSEEIVHVDGSVDPIRDLQMIAEELLAKDVQHIKTFLGGHSVAKRAQDKALASRLAIAEKVLEHVESGKDVKSGTWNLKEIDVINDIMPLTAKPSIYLINLTEEDFIRKKNKWLGKIKVWVDERSPGSPIIPISAVFESKLAAMDPEDAKKYCAEHANVSSMVPKIITAGYHHVQLIHFFTAGTDEVKCWTIRKGTKAPQAAGTIHTDFEKGFICAEVMKFEDWKEAGSEAAARLAGKYRTEGKLYTVADGDIINFKFNAAGGLTAKKK